MDSVFPLKSLINALVFSVVGVAALAVAFWIFDKITPGELWEEIVEKQNIAMAITAGAMMIALGQIIGAAVHG